MKILIMGSGAVGGYYGSVLHRGGHDVTFVARGEHLEAIKRRGLRIESVTAGDFSIRPTATDMPDGSWQADLALLCVKGYDNRAAMDTMRPAVGPGTSILTIQNGIGSGVELANAFGREKVLLGVTYVDAVRREPGMVAEVGGPTNIVFGREDGDRASAAVEVFHALQKSGIDTRLSSNIAVDLWNKLIFICALSGMMCIARAPITEVMETPETRDLTLLVLREVEAVARAKGIALDQAIVDTTMSELQQCDETTTSSMLVDLKRGNRLEVGVLNGAVVGLGRELGIETPVNEFITSCLTVAHNRAVSRSGQTG